MTFRRTPLDSRPAQPLWLFAGTTKFEIVNMFNCHPDSMDTFHSDSTNHAVYRCQRELNGRHLGRNGNCSCMSIVFIEFHKMNLGE